MTLAESGNEILETKNPGSKIAPGLKEGDIPLLMGKQWAQKDTRLSCQSGSAAFAHSGSYFSAVLKKHFASRSRSFLFNTNIISWFIGI